MIHSLELQSYRGFRRFEMSGLGRVNLLVGKNNSGKTSVLEALLILATGGDPSSVWRIISRRGEQIDVEEPTRPSESEVDIGHLFHGHELKPGICFTISTKNEAPGRSVTYTLRQATSEDFQQQSPPDRNEPPSPRFIIDVTGTPVPLVSKLPLSRLGGLRGEILERPRASRRGAEASVLPAQYISTESLTVPELTTAWNKIVLREAEERVLRALQFIEPKIERIAAITLNRYIYYGGGGNRGGFMVKLSDSDLPIPIGSLGDGIWRMLAMAIALIQAKDGILLVDEIDTGLHYSVMSEMWKLIYATAKEFDVQVFATTHSYDCIQSLATICHTDSNTKNDVTIQRIEIARTKSVPFSENEIRIAAERHIEMR